MEDLSQIVFTHLQSTKVYETNAPSRDSHSIDANFGIHLTEQLNKQSTRISVKNAPIKVVDNQVKPGGSASNNKHVVTQGKAASEANSGQSRQGLAALHTPKSNQARSVAIETGKQAGPISSPRNLTPTAAKQNEINAQNTGRPIVQSGTSGDSPGRPSSKELSGAVSRRSGDSNDKFDVGAQNSKHDGKSGGNSKPHHDGAARWRFPQAAINPPVASATEAKATESDSSGDEALQSKNSGSPGERLVGNVAPDDGTTLPNLEINDSGEVGLAVDATKNVTSDASAKLNVRPQEGRADAHSSYSYPQEATAVRLAGNQSPQEPSGKQHETGAGSGINQQPDNLPLVNNSPQGSSQKAQQPRQTQLEDTRKGEIKLDPSAFPNAMSRLTLTSATDSQNVDRGANQISAPVGDSAQQSTTIWNAAEDTASPVMVTVRELWSPSDSTTRVARLAVESGEDTVQATVREQAGAVEVKLVASNPDVAQYMGNELYRLQSSLGQVGVRLRSAEISYQGGDGYSGREYQNEKLTKSKSGVDSGSGEIFVMEEQGKWQA